MSGEQFADILVGLQHLHDVKSITYKLNSLTNRSIEELVKLFERRMPRHLEELRLIDVKASSSIIDHLVQRIWMQSSISKLALVNCQQSEKSFELIIKYVQDSRFLKDLDLSWCTVRHGSMVKLLNVIKTNKQLTHLNLSWNMIMDTSVNTQQIKDGGQSDELSPVNLAIMECFKEFVKYNPNLIELDLSNTKLNNAAILYLCYCLRRATSLRTLHLCGNMSRPRFFKSDLPDDIAE